MTVMKRPITPPDHHDDGDNPNRSTASVTFDESKVTMEPEELEPNDSDMPPSPNGIDINAHLVPNTVLVALLDRKQEMNDLVQHNRPFFQVIQRHLGPTNWLSFENILYSTRQQLPDKQWMSRIRSFLEYNNHVLSTFSELVGYMNGDDEIE